MGCLAAAQTLVDGAYQSPMKPADCARYGVTGGSIGDPAAGAARNLGLTLSVEGASAGLSRSAPFCDPSGPIRLGERYSGGRDAGPLRAGAEFSADASRRRIDLAATVLRTPRAKLALKTALFDSRHPSDRNALGLGLPLGWEAQAVREFQLDLSALGDRLRYQAGASWSRLTTDQAADQPALQRGGDLRHELNVDLVRGGPIAVSAYGTYRKIGTGFRPPKTGAEEEPDEAAPGKARELGLRFALDGVELLLSHGRADHRDAEAAEGGPVAERTGTASLWLDLDPFYDANERPWALLPASVRVSGSRTVVVSGDATEDRAEESKTLGIELAWWWLGTETTLGLSRGFGGARRARLEGPGGDDWSIELSHAIERGDWELSLSYSATRSNALEAGSRWATTAHTAGATVSARPERLPDLAVSLDFYKDRSRSRDIAVTARSRSLSLDASVDFSKLVWPGARPGGPRLGWFTAPR